MIYVFTKLGGLAIGVGNPRESNPIHAPTSLLCAFIFTPISVKEWGEIVRSYNDIEAATRSVINSHGGIIILSPSRIHLPDSIKGVQGVGEA